MWAVRRSRCTGLSGRCAARSRCACSAVPAPQLPPPGPKGHRVPNLISQSASLTPHFSDFQLLQEVVAQVPSDMQVSQILPMGQNKNCRAQRKVPPHTHTHSTHTPHTPTTNTHTHHTHSLHTPHSYRRHIHTTHKPHSHHTHTHHTHSTHYTHTTHTHYMHTEQTHIHACNEEF